MLTSIIGSLSPRSAAIIAVVSALVSIIAIIISIISVSRASRLKRRYRALVRGEDGANLEQLIAENHVQVKAIAASLAELSQQIINHEERIRRKVGPVAIRRYNAFGEKGNDLSFSMSFVDEHGNGAVISSIFGREESRVYAKPVASESSSYTLTDEEKTVIAEARL